jgi:hypothetical protein
VTSVARDNLVAPSEWDVLVAPEVAPLFVLDAAIVAAQRFFAIILDPTSSDLGGAGHPLSRDLLDAMCALRGHIRHYRLAEAAERGLDEAVGLDHHRASQHNSDRNSP